MASHRHAHAHSGGLLLLDVYAQRSRLRGVSPFVKLAFALGMLLLCVGAGSAALGLAVAVGMLTACAALGGAPGRFLLSLMALPLLFLAVSCLPIVFDVGDAPLGFFDVELFGTFLSATEEGLREAGRISLRACGAVSCLFFLSLTTPMQEILEVLRALHLPEVVIELMYLIYRYLFLLLEVQERMTTAAQSRLGYATWRASWYTFAHLSGGLLAGAFRRSGASLDAMEARCYDGGLRFLVRLAPVRGRHVAACALCFALTAALAALLAWKGVDLL